MRLLFTVGSWFLMCQPLDLRAFIQSATSFASVSPPGCPRYAVTSKSPSGWRRALAAFSALRVPGGVVCICLLLPGR